MAAYMGNPPSPVAEAPRRILRHPRQARHPTLRPEPFLHRRRPTGMSMDEIRSTLLSAKLQRLLAEALQRGERVLWQGQPDAVADLMMWRFLWWIGFPWLTL